MEATDRLIVVGAGYVGLVAAACFSNAGFEVAVVEKNKEKLEKLKLGLCPFYEPGLNELLQEGIQSKRLSFFPSQDEAFKSVPAKYLFCAVGTPENADGSANLTYVREALTETLEKAKGEVYFVLKSTVPVGTNQELQKIAESKSPKKIKIVNNPEFLREGTAISDFIRPERVLLGGDPEAVEAVGKIYESFLLNNKPLIKTDAASAELAKLGANLMLASRISLVNQIARLSDAVGANIRDIERVLQSDSRIGSKYLYAGLGFGGSCFPKDIESFIHLCKKYSVDALVAQSIDDFNDNQKLYFLDSIKKTLPSAEKSTVAILGLAFKPETDDIRESPSLVLTEKLLEAGYALNLYDPKASDNFKLWLKEKNLSENSKITFSASLAKALENADALLLVTEWQEFQRLTPKKLKDLFKGKFIFDGKNIFLPKAFKEEGYTYFGVGQS